MRKEHILNIPSIVFMSSLQLTCVLPGISCVRVMFDRHYRYHFTDELLHCTFFLDTLYFQYHKERLVDCAEGQLIYEIFNYLYFLRKVIKTRIPKPSFQGHVYIDNTTHCVIYSQVRLNNISSCSLKICYFCTGLVNLYVIKEGTCYIIADCIFKSYR